MKCLDLKCDAALDIFEIQVASRGVAGLDDVEKVAVGVSREEGEGGCFLPLGEKVGIEVLAWIAFYPWEGIMGSEVRMVFHAREECEKVLFELETDEFFGAHIAHGAWARRVGRVPGVDNVLGQKIDPASVSSRKGEGISQGCGCNACGCLVKLPNC